VHSEFSDATLILVGHGSTLNADSARPTWQHADELRRRQVFGQVIETFWKLEPGFAAALRAVRMNRVFIVPLFISEGYFTEEVIPRELGFDPAAGTGFPRRRTEGARVFHYCGPVGTHESMTEVLMARADEVVAQHPFPHAPSKSQRSLFIAGHGTGNNDNSRRAIEQQVELIRETGRYADVHAVFMEEEPRIESCWELATTRNLVMVPFFISDGLHSYEDIPMMLGEPERVVRQRLAENAPTWRNPTERNGKRLWYSRSIGNERHIADVIVQRAAEAAAAG
jgi:sirohydrochlorin cobaltochelatase